MKELTEVTKEMFFAQKYWGMLLSLDAKNCHPQFIRSEDIIIKYVKQLIELLGMKAYGPTEIVYFGEEKRVAGYSMKQFIETSSIIGHFRNENNSAYIDIFSCKYFCADITTEFTKNFFEADTIKTSILLRE